MSCRNFFALWLFNYCKKYFQHGYLVLSIHHVRSMSQNLLAERRQTHVPKNSTREETAPKRRQFATRNQISCQIHAPKYSTKEETVSNLWTKYHTRSMHQNIAPKRRQFVTLNQIPCQIYAPKHSTKEETVSNSERRDGLRTNFP